MEMTHAPSYLSCDPLGSEPEGFCRETCLEQPQKYVYALAQQLLPQSMNVRKSEGYQFEFLVIGYCSSASTWHIPS